MKSLTEILKTQDRYLVTVADTEGDMHILGSLTNAGVPLVFNIGERPAEVAGMLSEAFRTLVQAQHVESAVLNLSHKHLFWTTVVGLDEDGEPVTIVRDTLTIRKLSLTVEPVFIFGK